MSHLYYRLTNTTDPEERLEDAALYKALHDEFGKGLTLVPHEAPAPKDGLFFGRGKNSEFNDKNLLGKPGLPYWEDPAFQAGISRSFLLTDLEGAEQEVARLHAEGKDAFLKSTQQKHFIGRVDQGQKFHEELDGIVYSFIDRKDCLMVQEAVDMQFERRFLVINGEVVTHSPVAWHLTPMSRSAIKDDTGFDVEDLHYANPRAHEARFSPAATARMLEVAQRVASQSDTPHLCIDLAILGSDPENDPIEVIEFNPMQPGAVGLYACDPGKIAEATWAAMEPELREIVKQRRDGLLPSGYVEMAQAPLTPAQMAEGVHPVLQSMMGGKEALTEGYEGLFGSDVDEPFEDFEDFEDDLTVDLPEGDRLRPGISDDVVKAAHRIGCVEMLLLVDDLLEEQDEATAHMATFDLANMVQKSISDRAYRARFKDWLNNDGAASTVELRELMAELVDDGRTYWNDDKLMSRIDILDSASLHIEENAERLRDMEDIRQLAVEYGARFADIAEDEDLSRSYAWCADKQDIMSGADLGRYDEAEADRLEGLSEEVEFTP
jgi:hypothetical protein